jgi:SAM-dependent methyltransferase
MCNYPFIDPTILNGSWGPALILLLLEKMNGDSLMTALWRIYNRPQRPLLWQQNGRQDDGNLPWDDPAFSERMLREHLDESHGAASRITAEREAQLNWLWSKLALSEDSRLLDITCGPGLYAVPLAQRGCRVTGVDFGPAAVAYARRQAAEQNVADRCLFYQQDVRQMDFDGAGFDAAVLLYGQLAVMPPEAAQDVLQRTARALRPGGRLCLELLNPERVDKRDGRWWYTDDTGLWGERPYLHLGERFWDAARRASIERYLILHLETGQLDEINLCDQTYTPEEVKAMLQTAGFNHTDHYPAWDGLPLYDAAEWHVYIAEGCAAS